MTKGIILAGGTGSRLFPITKVISKQLLPVYNKPMIFLAIGLMINVGIKDIIIIVTRRDLNLFKSLLGDGKKYGVKFFFEIQNKANGIAEAFIITKKYRIKDKTILLLGDNFFYGHGLINLISKGIKSTKGASIFTYFVKNPNVYGVLEKKNGKIKGIIEKPKKPTTNLAITGLYIFDKKVFDYVKKLKPSKRGELEITDINNIYFKNEDIEIINLESGITWMDMGSFDTYLDACMFISATEKRQGYEIYNFK